MNTQNNVSPGSSCVPYSRSIDFICSKCGSTDVERQGSLFFCMECGATHPIIDSYYREQSPSSSSKVPDAGHQRLPHLLILLVSFLAALILSMLTFITIDNYLFSLPIYLAFAGFWGIIAAAMYLFYLLK